MLLAAAAPAGVAGVVITGGGAEIFNYVGDPAKEGARSAPFEQLIDLTTSGPGLFGGSATVSTTALSVVNPNGLGGVARFNSQESSPKPFQGAVSTIGTNVIEFTSDSAGTFHARGGMTGLDIGSLLIYEAFVRQNDG